MPGKKQFPLRLDPKLYKAIERWAADEFRSVNAQIEFLLRDTLQKAGRLNKSDARQDGADDNERRQQ